MPAFQTAGPITAIYPGDRIALVNDATVETGLQRTQQIVVTEPAGGGTASITVINATDKDAIGQTSADAFTIANYQPLSSLTVAAGTALPYNMSQGFLCFTFVVAPTTGSLTVAR